MIPSQPLGPRRALYNCLKTASTIVVEKFSFQSNEKLECEKLFYFLLIFCIFCDEPITKFWREWRKFNGLEMVNMGHKL